MKSRGKRKGVKNLILYAGPPPSGKVMKAYKKAEAEFKAKTKQQKIREDEYYGIRALLGYNDVMLFFLLGARETGKSYSVMEYFLRQWKMKKIPFYWLRLNEQATKRLLLNNALEFVDPALRIQFDLDLTVKGTNVYDHGERMATILSLSTFYNDKGVGRYDQNFLKDPNMEYHIALDEFQKEEGQRDQGDILVQFTGALENLIRSTKERVKIFCIANTLEEASDLLVRGAKFIPEEFGRYHLKKKRILIDYIPNNAAYNARRSGTIQNILMGQHSNFTNKINFDTSLITKKRLVKPSYMIVFGKNDEQKFTVWDNGIINQWQHENCKQQIAMRPYIDMIFNTEERDMVITLFDQRHYYYHNLITAKLFQAAIKEIKPRKG